MKRYLLIWQELPEQVRYYLIPSPTEEHEEVLTQANDLFFNFTDMSEEQQLALEKVHHAILSSKYWYRPEIAEEWGGIWESEEIQSHDLPTYTMWDKVFTMGVLL